ncbi:hypothetical protein EV122DRAFT_276916 [Schizophyllum commune]
MAETNANSGKGAKKHSSTHARDIPELPHEYAIAPEWRLECNSRCWQPLTVDCGHGNMAKLVDGRCIFEDANGQPCKVETSFGKADWIKHCRSHVAEELQTSLEYRCSFAGCDFTTAQKGGVKTHYVAMHLKLEAYVCEYCGEGFRRPDARSRHLPKCPKAKDKARQGEHPSANSTGAHEPEGTTTAAAETSRKVAKGARRNTAKAGPSVSSRAESSQAPKRAARKRERSISGPRDMPVKSRKMIVDERRTRVDSQGAPAAPPEAPAAARPKSPLPTWTTLPEPAETPVWPAETCAQESIDTQRRVSVAPAAMRGDPLTLRGASSSRLGSSTPTREGSVETLVPRESSVPPRHAFVRERSTFSNASTRLSRRDSLATPPPYTPVEGMSRRASFASLAATDEGLDAGDRASQEAVADAVATYGEDYLDDFYRRHNDHTDDEGTVQGEGAPFKFPGGPGDFEVVEERAYNSAPYDGDDDTGDVEDGDYNYEAEDDAEDDDDSDEDEEEVDQLDPDDGEKDLAKD